MGDFGTAVRYLDWVKSRQATLLEAQSAPVPFTKYYGIESSRQFKKIPYVLIIPKHIISADFDTYQYLPRLAFQYNITLPFSSYILSIDNFTNLNLTPGIVTVKWIDINTGAVTRYALKNGMIQRHKLCDLYVNQKIPKQFSVEFWLKTLFGGATGIQRDIHLKLSPITNPLFAEELERDITIEGPYDFPEFSWNVPFILPQINNIVPFPSEDTNFLLANEDNVFITDENGNKISLTLSSPDIIPDVNYLADESGNFITDGDGNKIKL